MTHDTENHDDSFWLMRYLSKARFRPGFALLLLPAELRCGGDGHGFHREQHIVGSPWWWGAHRGEATFLPLHHSLVDLDIAPRVFHLEAAPAPRCRTQESCMDSDRGCTWLTPPWPSIQLAASEVLCMPPATQLGFLPGRCSCSCISDFQEERGGQSDRWQMTDDRWQMASAAAGRNSASVTWVTRFQVNHVFSTTQKLHWIRAALQNYQGTTKPKIWISTPSCLIPSTTFCWHCEIKCFFPLSGHGNPMSSQMPYCAGGAEQIFVEVPAPVSVMFPHKKPLASLSVSTKNWKTVLRRRRGKKLLSNHYTVKSQKKIMHFRNRGRPPQRGSARQFFGNHFHSTGNYSFSWKKVSNEKHKELVHKKLSSKKKELNFLRENLNWKTKRIRPEKN